MADLSTETLLVLDIIEHALLAQVAQNDQDCPALLAEYPDAPAFVNGLVAGCDITLQLTLRVIRKLQDCD